MFKQLKTMDKNTSKDLENTKNIKYYYGNNVLFYTDIKDYKEKIKEEILEDKDQNFELYSEGFDEVFGGNTDE